MDNIEDLVINTIKKVILPKYKSKVTVDADLRNTLSVDSIKIIAIAAMLKMKGYDVMNGESSYKFSTVSTVKDVIDIVGAMDKGVN